MDGDLGDSDVEGELGEETRCEAAMWKESYGETAMRREIQVCRLGGEAAMWKESYGETAMRREIQRRR